MTKRFRYSDMLARTIKNSSLFANPGVTQYFADHGEIQGTRDRFDRGEARR
jgi:hypothetical protein